MIKRSLTVSRVVDGDTVGLLVDDVPVKVRLIGVVWSEIVKARLEHPSILRFGIFNKAGRLVRPHGRTILRLARNQKTKDQFRAVKACLFPNCQKQMIGRLHGPFQSRDLIDCVLRGLHETFPVALGQNFDQFLCGGAETVSLSMEDADRANEGVALEGDRLEGPPRPLILEGQVRDNRGADVDFDRVLDRGDMIEFHHNVGPDPVLSQESIDCAPRGCLPREQNERDSVEIFGRDHIVSGKVVAWADRDDHMVFAKVEDVDVPLGLGIGDDSQVDLAAGNIVIDFLSLVVLQPQVDLRTAYDVQRP